MNPPATVNHGIEAALVLVVEGADYALTVLPPTPFYPHHYVVQKMHAGPSHRHEVTQASDGALACGCDGWKYRHRIKSGMCRHVLALLAVNLLAAPVTGTRPPYPTDAADAAEREAGEEG